MPALNLPQNFLFPSFYVFYISWWIISLSSNHLNYEASYQVTLCTFVLRPPPPPPPLRPLCFLSLHQFLTLNPQDISLPDSGLSISTSTSFRLLRAARRHTA